jgi:hypothetical protein
MLRRRFWLFLAVALCAGLVAAVIIVYMTGPKLSPTLRAVAEKHIESTAARR